MSASNYNHYPSDAAEIQVKMDQKTAAEVKRLAAKCRHLLECHGVGSSCARNYDAASAGSEDLRLRPLC